MTPRPWQVAVEEILASLIDAGGKA